MKKAVCYYRVSSEKQRENESIDLQKDTHEDFIKAKRDNLAKGGITA